ncbi:MAG: hypothetical protein PHW96_00955 [Candidatus Nanoarchaeia archaeon]|nr:hypothetical protein [Candidatus Nanoarchaeia archaeon]
MVFARSKFIRRGAGFGIISGVITTLGLFIGVYYSTSSLLAVIAGIISIAVADAFSDSLGMHISEETMTKSQKGVWKTTISTFVAKLLVAMSFLIPVLFFDINIAIILSLVYGYSIISIYSYFIAKKDKKNPLCVIGEHTAITTIVLLIVYFVGVALNPMFVI